VRRRVHAHEHRVKEWPAAIERLDLATALCVMLKAWHHSFQKVACVGDEKALQINIDSGLKARRPTFQGCCRKPMARGAWHDGDMRTCDTPWHTGMDLSEKNEGIASDVAE
jgi:hypothetical protein